MIAALATELAGRAVVIDAERQDSVAAVRAAPRATGMVLLAIAADVPKLDRTMLISAIGPLAEELAPETRLAALDIGDGAVLEDVLAAARFLVEARSTTGQILRVTAR